MSPDFAGSARQNMPSRDEEKKSLAAAAFRARALSHFNDAAKKLNSRRARARFLSLSRLPAE